MLLSQTGHRTVNDWIKELAPGSTFADVGGLWGTVNEKVSIGIQAGATRTAMIDDCPLDYHLWADFHRHMAGLGLKGYETYRADATNPSALAAAGTFDVVHCSGIIYHLPNPYQLITSLRSVTNRHLILASMVVPEVIKNDAGVVDLDGGRAVFLPALAGPARTVVARHFELLGLNVASITESAMPWHFPDGGINYGPWWWLMTPAILKCMVELAGFHVIDMIEAWEDRAVAVVARVRAY